MPLISIVTPVYGEASARLLPEAYASLVAQELPAGWEWEWVIQEDDEHGPAVQFVPTGDERVRFANGRHGGPGVARTLALGHSRGTLIRCLDADDQLTAGALAREISTLEDPSIGWTTCAAIDLLPDGTHRSFPLGDPEPGRIARGAVLAHWRGNGLKTLMVLPSTLCIRRQLAVALGGWMALPASEDTGLLIGASAAMDGWFISEPGMLYRKWSGQVTAQAAHVDEVELTLRYRLISERGDAVAQLLNQFSERVARPQG